MSCRPSIFWNKHVHLDCSFHAFQLSVLTTLAHRPITTFDIDSLWSTKFLCGSLVTATLHTFVDLVWTHYLETIGDTTIRRYIYLIYLDFTALHCGNPLIHTLGPKIPTLSESPSLSHPPQFQNVRVWGLLCAGEFVAGSPRSLQPGWVWE